MSVRFPGAAHRFGAHKLIQRLADGVPLGVAAGRNLLQALPESIAVVRPGDHLLIEAFAAEGLQVVENPLAAQGMGGSLVAGVRAAAGAEGWLVALADMPWIGVETIRMLSQSLRRGASMVAPAYRGRRGHPVGFATRWGAELCALGGDQGARSLLAAHPDQLVIHETDDEGVLLDIDYPQDLHR